MSEALLVTTWAALFVGLRMSIANEFAFVGAVWAMSTVWYLLWVRRAHRFKKSQPTDVPPA
jgi:hypothetical protein